MEKLELKHLAGYLPYETKYMCNGVCYILSMTRDFDYENSKLILRPLSDLTKDENFDLYMDLCEELGVVQCEHLLLALQDNLKYAFNLQSLNVLEEFMYKNHFDWKYNLIENNLAIDINTLNK